MLFGALLRPFSVMFVITKHVSVTAEEVWQAFWQHRQFPPPRWWSSGDIIRMILSLCVIFFMTCLLFNLVSGFLFLVCRVHFSSWTARCSSDSERWALLRMFLRNRWSSDETLCVIRSDDTTWRGFRAFQRNSVCRVLLGFFFFTRSVMFGDTL